jgi:hypothetical protein
MDKHIVFDAHLTPADRIVLEDLAQDVRNGLTPAKNSSKENGAPSATTTAACALLDGLNDPSSVDFEPTVFTSVDLRDLQLPKIVDRWLLRPYIDFASKIVRHKTDVVFVTHLALYISTTIPSALVLFSNFTWIHGVLHFVMQFSYMGAYTIMMHQHIHQRGILRKELALFDRLFPYVLDPLMGHTWNSYFYHHVKHHHVEGTGPNDLSSTIRYQRDSLTHFIHYWARFFLFAWCELPLYFFRTKRYWYAAMSAFWEWSSYVGMYLLWTRVDARAAFFAVVLPFLLLRVGLMLGNWGQHAFVDDQDPDSDYRTSITLVDTTVRASPVLA